MTSKNRQIKLGESAVLYQTSHFHYWRPNSIEIIVYFFVSYFFFIYREGNDELSSISQAKWKFTYIWSRPFPCGSGFFGSQRFDFIAVVDCSWDLLNFSFFWFWRFNTIALGWSCDSSFSFFDCMICCLDVCNILDFWLDMTGFCLYNGFLSLFGNQFGCFLVITEF